MSGAVPLSQRHPFVELFFSGRQEPISSPLSGSRPASVFVSGMVYEIVADVGSRVQIQVIDPNFDELQELIRFYKDSFSFRYGWRAIDKAGREDAAYVSPKIGMRVVDWDMDWVGGAGFGGTALTLNGYDFGIDLGLDVALPISAFPENMRVSTAMEHVIDAAANSISRGGENTLRHRVTPTSNTLENANCRYIGNNTAAQFLARLKSIAKPASGFGPYVSRPEPIDEGRRTLLVIEPRGLKGEVARSYVFSRSQLGEVISYAPRYRALYPLSMGGARSQAVYWNGATKDPRVVVSDRQDTPALAPKYDRPFDGVSRTYEIAVQSDVAAQASIDRVRQEADSAYYEATLVVQGDVGLRVLDQVEVIVIKGGRVVDIRGGDLVEVHREASGVFTIFGVTQQVQGGRFTSTMTLRRTAGFLGSQDVREIYPVRRGRAVGEPSPSLIDKTVENLLRGL